MKRFINAGLATAIAAAASVALMAPAANAAPASTHTWQGNLNPGNPNWTANGNWVEGAPACFVNDTLVFGPTASTATKKRNTNDFPANCTFSEIQLTDSGYNDAARLKGNPVTLTNQGPIVEMTAAGVNTIALPITTTGATHSINVATGGVLNFNSAITNVGLLTFQGDGRVNINAGLTGGNLGIQGSGVVVVNSPISGVGTNFQVGSGTLILNSVLSAGTDTNNSGTLGGSGSTTGKVNVNGTLAPGGLGDTAGTGASGPIVGTFTTSGGVDLTGGRYRVDVTPGAADKLNVTGGQVNLNGANLELDVSQGPIPLGATYTIIDKTSGGQVTGSFTNAPNEGDVVQASGGGCFRVSYMGGTGNDVTITAVGPGTPGCPGSPAAQPTTTIAGCSTSAPFTCTVNVTGPVPPAGSSVSCFVNGSFAGAATTNASGQAIVPLSSPPMNTTAGASNTATCYFNGGNGLTPSASTSVTYTVAGGGPQPPITPTVSCAVGTSSVSPAPPAGSFVSFGYVNNATGAFTLVSSAATNGAGTVPTPVYSAPAGSSRICVFNGATGFNSNAGNTF